MHNIIELHSKIAFARQRSNVSTRSKSKPSTKNVSFCNESTLLHETRDDEGDEPYVPLRQRLTPTTVVKVFGQRSSGSIITEVVEEIDPNMGEDLLGTVTKSASLSFDLYPAHVSTFEDSSEGVRSFATPSTVLSLAEEIVNQSFEDSTECSDTSAASSKVSHMAEEIMSPIGCSHHSIDTSSEFQTFQQILAIQDEIKCINQEVASIEEEAASIEEEIVEIQKANNTNRDSIVETIPESLSQSVPEKSKQDVWHFLPRKASLIANMNLQEAAYDLKTLQLKLQSISVSSMEHVAAWSAATSGQTANLDNEATAEEEKSRGSMKEMPNSFGMSPAAWSAATSGQAANLDNEATAEEEKRKGSMKEMPNSFGKYLMKIATQVAGDAKTFLMQSVPGEYQYSYVEGQLCRMHKSA